MSSEILVNSNMREIRVALTENNQLAELFIEHQTNKGIVGNIYKGVVTKVLPGMQVAFVDMGLDKAGFLCANNVDITKIADLNKKGWEIGQDKNTTSDAEEESSSSNEDSIIGQINHKIPIQDLLEERQEIIVQVTKNPLGTKGARLTMHVTIPSRYVVLMPDTETVGISSKIEDEEERTRLKSIVQSSLATSFPEESEVEKKLGFIVRTAAEGVDEEAITTDINFLALLWKKVNENAAKADTNQSLYSDLPLVHRVLRDMVSEHIDVISVDSRESHVDLLTFSKTFIPELTDKIELYTGDRPIFDLHGVEDEIQKSLKRNVQLKSGGYLIIDQTEAMTTIDVNTGGFVGHRNLEETIFKTNLEAAQALARQLRLRNLGGIIILDFIDMQDNDHKEQVVLALEKALKNDPAKTSVTSLSNLGLIEMTRKRTRESLEHVLCESCATCDGRGYIKTATTVCYEIFREILREFRQFDARELLVLASQDVTDLLLDEESDSLAELQEFIGVPIRFQAETLYTQEQFDVVLL